MQYNFSIKPRHNLNPNILNFGSIQKTPLNQTTNNNPVSLGGGANRDTLIAKGKKLNKKKVITGLTLAFGALMAGVSIFYMIKKGGKISSPKLPNNTLAIPNNTPLTPGNAHLIPDSTPALSIPDKPLGSNGNPIIPNQPALVSDNAVNLDKPLNVDGSLTPQELSDKIMAQVGEFQIEAQQKTKKLFKSVINKTDEIFESVNKKRQEVTQLFQKGSETTADGRPVRIIEDSNYMSPYYYVDNSRHPLKQRDCKIMREFAQDGKTIARESILDSKENVVVDIKEFAQDGTTNRSMSFDYGTSFVWNDKVQNYETIKAPLMEYREYGLGVSKGVSQLKTLSYDISDPTSTLEEDSIRLCTQYNKKGVDNTRRIYHKKSFNETKSLLQEDGKNKLIGEVEAQFDFHSGPWFISNSEMGDDGIKSGFRALTETYEGIYRPREFKSGKFDSKKASFKESQYLGDFRKQSDKKGYIPTTYINYDSQNNRNEKFYFIDGSWTNRNPYQIRYQ